jgi:hypothetical protein
MILLYPAGADIANVKFYRWAAMQIVYHQAGSRFDGVWGANAQDR